MRHSPTYVTLVVLFILSCSTSERGDYLVHRIEHQDELIGGLEAAARVGDYVLQNEHVRLPHKWVLLPVHIGQVDDSNTLFQSHCLTGRLRPIIIMTCTGILRGYCMNNKQCKTFRSVTGLRKHNERRARGRS